MATQFGKPPCLVGILALTCVISHTGTCWAGGSACVSGTSVRACVEWSLAANPDPDTDFRVTFNAGGEPNIVLKTGDGGWEVYAVELVDGQPTNTVVNIASLTIDPSSPSQNFTVAITKDGGAGAADVGTINLDAGSWSGHSSIGSGSHIAGDLTGPLTIESDANGAGGKLSLTIDGDVLPGAAISAPVLKWLQLSGDLRAALAITNYVETGAYFVIGGSIDSQVNIDIASMPGKCQLELAVGSPESDLAGQLLLHTGVDAGQTVKVGNLSGVVDLLGADVVGWFEITGDATGEIVNGGDIRDGGFVTLNTEGEFSGNATFQSVGALSALRAHGGMFSGSMTVLGDVATGGFVGAHGGNMAASAQITIDGDLGGRFEWPRVDQYDGDARGTVQIGGNMKGEMVVGGGVIGSIAVLGQCPGDMLVAGDLSGAIDVLGDCPGDIRVGGKLLGSVSVGANLSGLIESEYDIEGSIDVDGTCSGDIHTKAGHAGTIVIDAALTSTGRVRIDQQCAGLVNVRGVTQLLSLVRAGGLGATGEIRISEIPGLSSTSRGTIHVGPVSIETPLPPVTFDVRIRVNPGGSNAWQGTVYIVGCHATADPLDICLCGDIGGILELVQGDCANQVTVACGASCP
ncbi:hypothetical protein RAS1_06350 [Phycisphaerae bacterium RAS1]|nr:hypothetical protein RAS1_06350 [Phycisphaerae bacterium RAS1]